MDLRNFERENEIQIFKIHDSRTIIAETDTPKEIPMMQSDGM